METKKIIYISVIVIVFLLAISGSLFVGAKYKNDLPLIQTIMEKERAQVLGDYDKALQEANDKISNLKSELDKTKKTNEELNTTLSKLKKKSAEIKEPKDMSEIVKRFKDLGYDVQ